MGFAAGAAYLAQHVRSSSPNIQHTPTKQAPSNDSTITTRARMGGPREPYEKCFEDPRASSLAFGRTSVPPARRDEADRAVPLPGLLVHRYALRVSKMLFGLQNKHGYLNRVGEMWPKLARIWPKVTKRGRIWRYIGKCV